MNTICVLKNTIQDYAWGSFTAIPDLLGMDDPHDKPRAELWMGAHPKASSMVFLDNDYISLEDIIKKYPEDLLGRRVVNKFGQSLPFLFKVLAAGKPLSIQAHPSREEAFLGFKRENDLGIELSAFNRNYKDDNHKPECICALTDFWAMCGFRKTEKICLYIEKICPKGLKENIDDLSGEPDTSGLKKFYTHLLAMEQPRKERVIKEVMNNVAGKSDDPVCFWINKLNNSYPGDIGIISPAVLNLICLKPGQALFLPAGELHAYLEGTGMELMTNSDNVLRGGLTPKHIDAPELLKVLNFDSMDIEILSTDISDNGEIFYRTPASEFILSKITVESEKEYLSNEKRSIEILFCIEGDGEIINSDDKNTINFTKGTSLLIPAAVRQYKIKGAAAIFKAAVPT